MKKSILNLFHNLKSSTGSIPNALETVQIVVSVAFALPASNLLILLIS